MPGIYDFGIRPLNLSADFEAGQEKARQKGLRSLMGDYYGAQDPRLGEVARMGGDAGGMQRDMQGQDDRKREQLGQFASLLAKAPVNMRPGIYKQMYPQLSQIVPDAPADYTPEIDQMTMQIAQMYGGAKAADGAPAQQRYLEFLASQVPETERQDVFRNAAGTNPRARSQLYEGEGGAFNVNLGNNRATPITTGGPMPAQAPQQPSSTFTLDDAALDTLRNVPPQERAAAMQAMMTGGTFAAINGEAVPAPNQQPGAQLRPAAKPQAPQAPSELQRRVAMAQQMGATPEEIKRLVVGGGQSGNAQAQKTGQGNRIKMAQLDTVQRQIDRLDKAAQSVGGNKIFDGGPLDQYAVKFTPQGQELEQSAAAILPVLTALTRVPGVGAQSDLESRLASLQLPSAAMAPEVNKAAIQALREYMSDLKAAYQNIGGQQPAPAATPANNGWSIKAVD